MKRNKGFTLVELLIVIVIIGILAAIIVPSVSSAIEKANLANDQSDVKNMNTILALQAIEDNVDYYGAYDVQRILGEQGYSLVPKASGYIFQYDTNTNSVKIEKEETAFEVSTNAVGNVYAGSADIQLESVFAGKPNLLYIDKGDRPLTTVIETIRNIVDESGIPEAIANVAEGETIGVEEAANMLINKFSEVTTLIKGDATISGLLTHFDNYNPETTIYVTEHGFFGGHPDNIPNEGSLIIGGISRFYIPGYVKVIPECNVDSIVILGENDDESLDLDMVIRIDLPMGVEEVKPGAFNNISGGDITLVANSNLNLSEINVAPHIKVRASSNVSTMVKMAVDYVYTNAKGETVSQALEYGKKNYLPFSYVEGSYSGNIGRFVVDMDSIRHLISKDSKVEVKSSFDSISGQNMLVAYVKNADGTIAAAISVRYIYVAPEVAENNN